MAGSASNFTLDDLRNPFGRSHKRNSSEGGLLDDYELVAPKRRKPSIVDLSRLLRWLVISLLVLAGLFYWKYELHVELQLFNRGWIRESILAVSPPSSVCFSPSHVSSTLYNETLASAPKHVDVQAGIGMTLGRDCYDFAATIPRSPTTGMELPHATTFHLYWRHDLLPLGPRQVALLESILATQDRQTTKVTFWTNAHRKEVVESLPVLEPLFERYGRERLQIEKVDKRELAKGTPMQGNDLLDMADRQAWVDGDLVRILVLYQRGGIWVDFDTILTGRDLRVLGEHEWVTQWDCYDKVYQPLNGAMMHFYLHSPYLCEMLHLMSTSPPPAKNSVDWGARLYHRTWRSLVSSGIKPFKVLPYCFTDGVSCRLDNRLPDPFGETRIERKWGTGRWQDVKSKLDNVWAVHLHNRWEKGFPKGGYIDEMILKPISERAKRYPLRDQL